MKSSLEIERSIEKRPIAEVAAALGLDPDGINLHGKFIAKLPLSILDERSKGPDGSLILVTAMTPTREGIGKTTVTIGLADALRRLGENAALCIRSPPSAPTSASRGERPVAATPR